MPPIGSKLRSAFIMALWSLSFLGIAVGQGRQSGEIRGTVTDPSQALLVGVKVAVSNVATGVSLTTTTDTSGIYDVPFVQPGRYDITFAKDNFKTLTRSGITVNLATITVNATLQVGATSEIVSVYGEAPLLQTESTERNTTLTSSLVSSAPSINRSWQDLFAALPGVNPGKGEASSGQGIGVNGQQSFFSNWQIDGGIAMLGQSSNNDTMVPPIETIQEVSLTTANFGAEHGNGLSVFNVITKSGTNKFHGSVYEYIENDAANAMNKFAQAPPFQKPSVRWNEYGFNLGGPIKKNKAFFFFSYERNPIHSYGPTYNSYPTTGPQANGGLGYREGDFSSLDHPIYDPLTGEPFPGNIIPQDRFDPVAVEIQKYFPKPNLPGMSGDPNVNNYYSVQSGWNIPHLLNRWINSKVDVDITPKNRLSASLMLAHFDQFLTDANCAINCSHWKGDEPQGQITDVWTVNPKLVNEFRVSLSREHGVGTVASAGQGWAAKLGLANPAGDFFPNIWINGDLNTDIGNSAVPPAIDAETTYITSNAATWVKGKHILKFGGEFDRWQVNTGWGTGTEGGFWWGGDYTGEGYADFLLGLPASWWISISPETGGRMWSAQAFVQDEYKVKPNLTLTLGLRYVIQSGWSEVHNQISSFQPAIVNPADGTMGAMWYGGRNGHRAMTSTIPDFFAPRIGVAWSPKPNWSIRGGFGIYNIIAGQNTIAPAVAWGQGWVPAGDLWYGDRPVFQMGNRTPNFPGLTDIGPPLPIYPTDQNRTADLFNGNNVNYTPWNIPMEYSAEYQLDVQHQFPGGYVLDVGYVGNRGVNLQYGRDINQICIVAQGCKAYNGTSVAQGERPYPNFARIDASLFDGRSNYNALQIIGKKQFAQGLSFSVNYVWSKVLDTMTSSGWGGAGAAERYGQNYQNAYDPNSNYGPASNDIRHTFNGSMVYALPFGNGKRFLNQAGVVNAIAGGWELSSIFHIRSGIPFSVVMGTDGVGTGSGQWRPNQVGNPSSGTCPGNVPVRTANCWFNTSAFEAPPDGTFGNVGRNSLYGPNWRTVDIALLKNFPLKQLGEGGQLQFKVSATDVFNHPNLSLPDATYTDGGFGIISGANTSRQMQLGVKISF
jgi:carboxypeptidase family protein/TonB-dependent receptor-like protein